MSVSNEKLNEENIASIDGEFVWTNVEIIHPRDKYDEFSSMCDCPDKYIKIPK